MPVSITSAASCPSSCVLKGRGCYAENFPLGYHWQRVSEQNAKAREMWIDFLWSVSRLPRHQLWRHNQAGDLPGKGNRIARGALAELVRANRGRRGFTYTQKPITIRENARAIKEANRRGFTINLSGINPTDADRLARAKVGPVTTILPSSIQGNVRLHTPEGRRIVVCPATYREETTCVTCALCAIADRKVVVGFPAHGSQKKRVEAATNEKEEEARG